MKQWDSEAERKDLVKLRLEGREWHEVALALNAKHGLDRTAHSCSGKFRRMRLSGELYSITVQNTHEDPTYEELIAEWNEWIGRTPKEVKTPKTKNSQTRRIGIITDSHCPYESEAVIKAFVEDGPYDIIIHGGDLLDYESVSSFVHDRGSSMRTEIQHGTRLLETLSQSAEEVVITTDNHSKRILKMLSSSNLPPELLEILSWLSPHLDIFSVMSEGLPNVRVASRTEPARDGSPVTLSFLVQRGDLIVGHPDSSSSIPLRSVHKFNDWLVGWKDVLGLDSWNVVAMGHTHATGMSFGHGGYKLYMELGAAVKIEGVAYALRGKMGYRAPVPTYTVMEQERDEEYGWKTDMNSVRQVVVL